jgi:hypothetical protein
MADDIKKPEDEIAALKARVEELERANKPPKPFVPEPYQRYDPTAGMSMPRSALEANDRCRAQRLHAGGRRR